MSTFRLNRSRTHKVQSLFDLLLGRQQRIQRAIPLVQLLETNLHPLLFGDPLSREPIGFPSPPTTVADEGVFQPPSQTMFTLRFAQAVGHQHKGHLRHLVLLPARRAKRCEDLTEIHLIPQVPCQQDRSPRERFSAGHLLSKGELFPAVFAERGHQVIELVVHHVQAPEVGENSLLGPSVVAVGFDDLDVVIFLVAAVDLLGACEHKPAPP